MIAEMGTLRVVVKLLLYIPMLAGIAAFTYTWAMGIRASFKWRRARRAKTPDAIEWREQFILYWVLGVLAWLGMAVIGLIINAV